MTVNIQNMATLTDAVQDLLKNSEYFNQHKGWTIERSEFLNDDPNNCPWCGIYRREINYETLNLGKDIATAWEGEIQISILLQRSGYTGSEVEDNLEADIKELLLLVLSQGFISQYADRVINVKITYTFEDETQESFHFQTAIIDITLEAANG